MTISDIIFDNMMTMIRELVENDKSHHPLNKKHLINLIATMVKTSNYLERVNDESNPLTCQHLQDEFINLATEYWDDCYEECQISDKSDSEHSSYMQEDDGLMLSDMSDV